MMAGAPASIAIYVRIVVLVLLVGSTVYAGAGRLVEIARLARQLARVEGVEARRAIVFGSWFTAVQQLRRGTPSDATIDFVMLRHTARDIAVLGAADLQPRDVRLFDGWDAWKQRRRAILVHDARGANAVPGVAPPPARFIVVVDPDTEPALKLVEPPR